MSDRARRLVAWTVLAIALACVPAAVGLAVATGYSPRGSDALALAAVLTFSIVGGFVAAGAPRNAVAWLLLAIGVTTAVGLPSSVLYHWDKPHPGGFAGASLNAWVNGMTWLVTLGFLIPRVMLLFPDGRLPSRRWRTLSVAQWALLCGFLLTSLRPGPIQDYEQYDNPLGVSALGFLRHPPPILSGLSVALVAGVLLASAVSPIVRFRHSRGVERLQMKWAAWGVGITAVLWLADPLAKTVTASGLGPVPVLGVVLWPITVGIAVLRYRLYEIDRLISRTLVYGLLTVVLGALYAGLVLGGQALLSSFAGGSNLAIAVSTLVVAALFLPLRGRVQVLVDRRFYRSRYDAQRTLEAFGARLREQVDLETLTAELGATVRETLQPRHVSLWLGGREQ